MTTCNLWLVELPEGRKQVSSIRYFELPKDMPRIKTGFLDAGSGLSQIAVFHTWAEENRLKVEVPDHVTYVAPCKRVHLLDFWRRCYAQEILSAAQYLASGDEVLRDMKEQFINGTLKTIRVLESLNSRRLYALIAYEY